MSPHRLTINNQIGRSSDYADMMRAELRRRFLEDAAIVRSLPQNRKAFALARMKQHRTWFASAANLRGKYV